MAIITPDFSEAVEFHNPTKGAFNTRITKIEGQNSKKSGAPMLKVTFSIFGAEGDDAKFNKSTVSDYCMISGPGAGKLKDLCIAALGEVPTPLDTDLLLGKEVHVILQERFNEDGTVSNFPNVKKVVAIK